MSNSLALYEFVFRGLLAEEALDSVGRIREIHGLDQELSKRLPIDGLDEKLVISAKQMATVYTAIAAFENSARLFISAVLRDSAGEKWWEQKVSAAIQKKAETRRVEEAKIRWHASRGQASISYTDFGDLGNIIGQNWNEFQDFIPSLEWAKAVFDVIERSRNVIMHSGFLELEDVERVGINIRDWIKQVGV